MATKIPDAVNEELLKRASKGQTTRQLADWLVEAKKMPRCSHVTVSRRLFALRAAEANTPKASANEIERQLRANTVLLQDADEALAELQEVALFGDGPDGK